MEYYHGTNFSNGQSILNDKKIRCDAKKIYNTGDKLTSTTENYVYITQNIYYALHFATKASFNDNVDTNMIYIFKFKLTTDNVETDPDELAIDYSFQDNQNSKYSFRISKNVELYGSDAAFMLMDYQKNRELINCIKEKRDSIYTEEYKNIEQKKSLKSMLEIFIRKFNGRLYADRNNLVIISLFL